MTEERYVITEDQYEKLLDTCKTGAEIGVLNEVYRQPLSTELRKERERVLKEIGAWANTHGFPVRKSQDGAKMVFVHQLNEQIKESLRGEP